MATSIQLLFCQCQFQNEVQVWACLKPEPAIGVWFSWVAALNPEPQVWCRFGGFSNQTMASLMTSVTLAMYTRRFCLQTMQTQDHWDPICLQLCLCMWLALGPSLQLRQALRLLVCLLVVTSALQQHQAHLITVMFPSIWHLLLIFLPHILMSPIATCWPCNFWQLWLPAGTWAQSWALSWWTPCSSGLLLWFHLFTLNLMLVTWLG